MAGTSKNTNSKTNGWDALTNVLIASMNKGQFPLAIAALVFSFMIWRMPSEDVSKLVFQVFNSLIAAKMLGYGLFALTVGSWFAHAKSHFTGTKFIARKEH
jgi:hypothetical protein